MIVSPAANCTATYYYNRNVRPCHGRERDQKPSIGIRTTRIILGYHSTTVAAIYAEQNEPKTTEAMAKIE